MKLILAIAKEDPIIGWVYVEWFTSGQLYRTVSKGLSMEEVLVARD